MAIVIVNNVSICYFDQKVCDSIDQTREIYLPVKSFQSSSQDAKRKGEVAYARGNKERMLNIKLDAILKCQKQNSKSNYCSGGSLRANVFQGEIFRWRCRSSHFNKYLIWPRLMLTGCASVLKYKWAVKGILFKEKRNRNKNFETSITLSKRLFDSENQSVIAISVQLSKVRLFLCNRKI